jgi:CubicO group peptidase (beta-lactamase class C family)
VARNAATTFNDPSLHALEIPWAGGIASARGLAKVYADVVAAEPTLCRAESIEPLGKRQSWSERDRVLRKPLGFSQGFLKEECHVFSPGEEAFGHSGMGGALGLADPKQRLAFAYVMNRMDFRVRSPRCLALCHALYGCI